MTWATGFNQSGFAAAQQASAQEYNVPILSTWKRG
jgi:hypothetical protein